MSKKLPFSLLSGTMLMLLFSAYVLAQQDVVPVNSLWNLGTHIPTKELVKQDQNVKYVPGEMIVKFKPTKINLKTTQGENFAKTFASEHGMEAKENLGNNNITVMKFDESLSVKDKIASIKSDANVEYAEPNYIYKIQSFNDSLSGNLRGLQKINRYQGIGSFSGNTNTTGTIVAVIDVGVAHDHPDLVNNMRDGSSCKNEGGVTIGGCIHGYDFANNDKDPYALSSDHGTHVAGTIAAVANNGIGVIGVNPNAKIMAIRAGDENLSLSAIIKGIDFARYNGAKIINASFGDTAYSSGMYDAINNFRSAGGLVFVAAGNETTNNDATPQYPCNYTLDNIVCVAATDSNDNLAGFSNYGATSVDVGAPGTSILSTAFTVTTGALLFQDFESLSTGEVPNGWTKSGGGANNRGAYNIGSSRGYVLLTDMDTPYTNNVDTSISFGTDTSGSQRIGLNFRTICDTEYNSTSDYMTVEVRPNASTGWTELGKWNEYLLDNDTNAGNNAGGMTYDNLNYDLDSSYASSSFQVRFRRVTNGTDNNYNGCLVDDVQVVKYSQTKGYAYKQGTSMATPHVAGLASLAWNVSPTSSYSQIRDAIINSGDIVASLAGKTTSSKRINVFNTLSAFLDTIPDVFTFSSITGATINSLVTGNTITVSGINTGSQITIDNGEYSINGGGRTSVTGIVYNQDTVTIRQISSTGYNTAKTATLTIGGVSGNFSVTTQADPNSPTCILLKNPATWTSGSVQLVISGTSENVIDTGYSFNLSGGFGSNRTGVVQTGGIYTAYVQNAGGSIGSCSTGVYIDKTAPVITVTSHTNNQEQTGSVVTLLGTSSDVGCQLSSLLVNGMAVSTGGSRSAILSLAPGINTITLTGTDCVGNTTATSLNLIRKNYIVTGPTTIVSGSTATIGFTTDITAQGFVKYGTSSSSLNLLGVGSSGATSHSIILTGLAVNTTYYYQVYAVANGYTGASSSIASFSTPIVVDPSTITNQVITTGTIQLSGAAANGITFTTTGTLVITNSGQTQNRLEINLSGFIIQSSNRDGMLTPPAVLGSSDTNNATTSELGVSSSTNTVLATIQAGSTGSSLTAGTSNTYFKISFVVSSGSSGEKLDIYRSSNGSARSVNSPDSYCKLDANKICTFRTDHLSYFSTVRVSSSSSGGGGGGGGSSSSADTCVSSDLVCIDGEYEPKPGIYCEGGNLGKSCSSSDTSVEDILNNLISSVGGTGSTSNSPYATERNSAYLYAYKIGITTMSTIQKANMTGNLLRSHMAKMMVNYAVNVLDKTPDTTRSCSFSDISNETTELQSYIKQACQLGLMGQGISLFYPKGKVSRAEFGTVLSRALYGTTYNGGTPYYINHLKNLKNKGIISNTDATIREMRAYVMLMLMRASTTLD